MFSYKSAPTTKGSALHSGADENKNQMLFGASCIMLVVLGNWVDTKFIGITGIEILNGDLSTALSSN